METIGAFDAKTHLSSLLERVARGEKFTITRHGVPIATLLPVSPDAHDRRTTPEIAAEFRKIRKRVRPGPASIREMIEEGRRY